MVWWLVLLALGVLLVFWAWPWVDMTTRLKTFGALKFINARQLNFLRDLWERAL